MDTPSRGPGIVFIGSHLGYPMDRTPLGGGAMVGMHLARRLAALDSGLRLAALGSGPEAPFASSKSAEYARLAGVPEGIVDRTFCRR